MNSRGLLTEHEGRRRMSVDAKIRRVLEEVAGEQQIRLAPVTGKTVLADAGLDSLCFAIIVARLEDELGVDPFTASEEVYFPVTFADLVSIYENAAV
jgi:acyl carrier protein